MPILTKAEVAKKLHLFTQSINTKLIALLYREQVPEEILIDLDGYEGFKSELGEKGVIYNIEELADIFEVETLTAEFLDLIKDQGADYLLIQP